MTTEPTETETPSTEPTAPEPTEAEATIPEPPNHPIAHEMTRESQNWATTAHLSAFVQFLGVPSFLGPLIVWMMKRDDDPYVEAQAREALNFNISFMIYALVAGLAIFVLIGIVALPIVMVAWFIYVIIGAMAASRGENYRYPFTMRFIT